MTKKCPECGKALDEQEKICSSCGHKFDEINENNPKIEQSDIEHKEELSKEQNETIEWSSLKDISIGSVMNMFNEQHQESTIKNELPENVSDESLNSHKKIDKMTEKEHEAHSKESSTLYDYMENHRQENLEDNELDKESNEKNDFSSFEKEKDLTQETEEKTVPDATTEMNQEKQVKEDLTETKAFTIPSKSKKPEEIEMDEAPIFFKDETEPVKSNNLKQPVTIEKSNSKPKKENKTANSFLNKKQKTIAAVLFSAIILGGGAWFFSHSTTKNSTKKTENVVTDSKKIVATVKTQINNYFTDDKQNFIKPEMVEVSTKPISNTLNKIKSDADYDQLQALLEKVEKKQETLKKINALFVKPAIAGDKLNEGVLAADKPIDLKKSKNTDKFDQLIDQAIDQAHNQYDQLQKAKTSVSEVIKDNALTESATRELYDIAKQQVDAVKNETLKQPLLNQLTKANQLFTEREAVVQANQHTQAPTDITENNATTNQAGGTNATLQPGATDFSPANSNGVYTDPVYTKNSSDVADSGNPAWLWAPGVMENVIATTIQRGYVVEGGYYLEPARIVNGEGYYNLYATKRSPLLANFSEGDAPVYIVTINAKTGWFKGNASRNAGQ